MSHEIRLCGDGWECCDGKCAECSKANFKTINKTEHTEETVASVMPAQHDKTNKF